MDVMLNSFETITVADLEAASSEELDKLAFGVIGLRLDTTADVYNETESRASCSATFWVRSARQSG